MPEIYSHTDPDCIAVGGVVLGSIVDFTSRENQRYGKSRTWVSFDKIVQATLMPNSHRIRDNRYGYFGSAVPRNQLPRKQGPWSPQGCLNNDLICVIWGVAELVILRAAGSGDNVVDAEDPDQVQYYEILGEIPSATFEQKIPNLLGEGLTHGQTGVENRNGPWFLRLPLEDTAKMYRTVFHLR